MTGQDGCLVTQTTPWTVARQAPLSMKFSRQENWSGLSFPSPGDLPDPRIEPRFPALQADSLPSQPPGKPPIKIDIMVILIQDGNVSKDSPVFQPCLY